MRVVLAAAAAAAAAVGALLAARARAGGGGRVKLSAPVKTFVLRNKQGMEVHILSLGATIQRLLVPDMDGKARESREPCLSAAAAAKHRANRAPLCDARAPCARARARA